MTFHGIIELSVALACLFSISESRAQSGKVEKPSDRAAVVQSFTAVGKTKQLTGAHTILSTSTVTAVKPSDTNTSAGENLTSGTGILYAPGSFADNNTTYFGQFSSENLTSETLPAKNTLSSTSQNIEKFAITKVDDSASSTVQADAGTTDRQEQTTTSAGPAALDSETSQPDSQSGDNSTSVPVFFDLPRPASASLDLSTTATLSQTSGTRAADGPVVVPDELTSATPSEHAAASTASISGDFPTTITLAPPEPGAPETSVSLPLPIPAAPIENSEARIPVKLDRSSTAAQTQQLMKFEKRNQMAEAYLLAGELLRQNPGADFAYDAVIRTSLVLGQNDEVEGFYRDAITRSRMPGKYFVQLAHFLDRTKQTDKLKKLIQDYEKDYSKSGDYWVTTARLRTIMGANAEARAAEEKAIQQKSSSFPVAFLLARTARLLKQPELVRKTVLSLAEADLGPWEQRTLLIELVKTRGVKPEDIGIMFNAALVNESNYEIARITCDLIINQSLEQRIFHPLLNSFRKKVDTGEASDMDVWFTAMMEKREGNTTAALDLLTSDTSAMTPVIAHERAMSLIEDKRSTEALPILEVLLSEQPTDSALRLLIAEQHVMMNNSEKASATLEPISVGDLTTERRLKYCELLMSAVVMQGNPDAIVAAWTEAAQFATFADIQAMGDIIVRSRMATVARDKLNSVAAAEFEKTGAASLLLLRARLCANEGNHDAELDFYTEYCLRDSRNTQMLRFVAELASQYAAMPFRIVDEGEKHRPTSFTLRASNSSRSELALDLYRRLISMQPRIPDHYSAMIRLYKVRGEPELARRVAIELSESNTSSSEVQTMAAAVLDENGFTAESLYFYRSALRLNPDDFAGWMKYATALITAKRYTEAEAVYRKILENGMYGNPYDQPQVLAALLHIASESGTLPTLISYLDNMRAQEIPGKTEFYLSAAKLLIEVKEYGLAEKFLQDFQAKFADSSLLADSYLLLGQLYFTRKEYARAADQFQQTAEKFAGNDQAVTAAFNVGELRRMDGKYQEAVDLWVKLAKSFPENDKAISGLYEAAVVAYTDLKDNALTEKLLQQYVDAYPQDFKLMQKARESLLRLQSAKEASPTQPLPRPKDKST